MGFLSGVVGAVGNIASAVLGNKSAKNEAQKNRDWQEDMSNTSIQRRMADLKAAGLNPLLAVSSASSGASTPSGSVADVDYSALGNIGQSFSSARLMSAQAKGQELNNKNNPVMVEEVKANTEKVKADTKSQQLNNVIEEEKINIYRKNPQLLEDLMIAQLAGNPLTAFNTSTGRDNIKKTYESVNNAVGGGVKTVKKYIDSIKKTGTSHGGGSRSGSRAF